MKILSVSKLANVSFTIYNLQFCRIFRVCPHLVLFKAPNELKSSAINVFFHFRWYRNSLLRKWVDTRVRDLFLESSHKYGPDDLLGGLTGNSTGGQFLSEKIRLIIGPGKSLGKSP